MVEENEVLNKTFLEDAKKGEIAFSVYSIFELVNQKGLEKYRDIICFLRGNFNGFKIETNESFVLTDSNIIGDNISFEKLLDLLTVPIVTELKRNIVNRLLLVWFYVNHFQSIIRGEFIPDVILKRLIQTVRDRLSDAIISELSLLGKCHCLKEKEVKKVYKKISDIIKYNIILSYCSAKLNDIISNLEKINFSVCCPIVTIGNWLKLTITDMRRNNQALRNMSNSELESNIINVIRQRIELNHNDELENAIIEFDLRDIFINDDVFKANNYIDLFIMRMYIYFADKYYKKTNKKDCFLITTDQDFLKKMAFLYQRLSNEFLGESIKKSELYIGKKNLR